MSALVDRVRLELTTYLAPQIYSLLPSPIWIPVLVGNQGLEPRPVVLHATALPVKLITHFGDCGRTRTCTSQICSLLSYSILTTQSGVQGGNRTLRLLVLNQLCLPIPPLAHLVGHNFIILSSDTIKSQPGIVLPST